MLSSDILEEQFGSTELVIITQNDDYRIIETVAQKNKSVLELSFVKFNKLQTRLFNDVHREILAGTSMGKAFKNANIEFIRDIRSINREIVPSIIQSYFDHNGETTIVDVDIFVGLNKSHYCHILEIYNPSVVWPNTDYPKSSTINEALAEFIDLLTPMPTL